MELTRRLLHPQPVQYAQCLSLLFHLLQQTNIALIAALSNWWLFTSINSKNLSWRSNISLRNIIRWILLCTAVLTLKFLKKCIKITLYHGNVHFQQVCQGDNGCMARPFAFRLRCPQFIIIFQQSLTHQFIFMFFHPHRGSLSEKFRIFLKKYFHQIDPATDRELYNMLL